MKKKGLVLFIICMFLMNHLLISSTDKVIYNGTNIGPESLDPAQAWDPTSSFYNYNLYDRLVKFDPSTKKLVPSLATSWQIRENGTQWTFKLRRGVTFHDGTDLTADAVVFSFQRQLDKKFKYRYYDFLLFGEIFQNLKYVKKIDQYTVAFYLEKPFFSFLAALTTDCASIVSPAAVKKYGKNFPLHPVGSGPFKLKKWEKNKRVTLEANLKYWRGKPHIDGFVSLIKTQLPILQNLFRQQKIDMLSSYSISRTLGLKRLDWVSVHRSAILETNYIAFNLKNKYLQRKNIRKAIQFLWDKKIIKYVYQDFAIPSSSFLPPGIVGYKKTAYTQEFSFKKALELLKKENIKKEIVLNFPLVRGGDLDTQMIKLFLGNLKKAGIKTRLIMVSEEEYYKKIAAWDYDLALSGWVADYPDPHSFFYPLFSGKLQQEGLPSLYSINDKNIVQKIIDVSVESDVKKRKDMYGRLNRMIHEEIICIPVYHDALVFFYNNNRMESVTANSIGVLSLFEIRKK